MLLSPNPSSPIGEIIDSNSPTFLEGLVGIDRNDSAPQSENSGSESISDSFDLNSNNLVPALETKDYSQDSVENESFGDFFPINDNGVMFSVIDPSNF